MTAPIVTRYVATAAGPIHVRIGGVRRASVPPIVLIHHTPSSSAAMVAVAAALSPRWVIAPDLPGFGDSPPLRDGPTIGGWVDGFAELLARLEVTGATVLGHHAGAVVAAGLAAAHPARVDRLILSAPPPVATDARAELSARIGVPCAPTADGSHITAAWARVTRKSPELPVVLHHREAVLALAAGPTYARAFHAIMAHDLGATLARVVCPIWVTVAPDDPLAPYARAVAELTRAVWSPLPRGGVHVCDLYPDSVAQLVLTTEEPSR